MKLRTITQSILLSMTILFGLTISCAASTFLVTNTNDSGPGSLRQAVSDANDRSNTDTIAFTVTGTITLTTGPLTITNPVTIVGPGANLLSISGNNSATVFVLNSAKLVTFSGLTITNGKGATFGGGLYCVLTAVVFKSCAITNNYADNGAGMLVFFGSLEMTNCTVSGNQTEFQGTAINIQDASGRLTNCTVSDNVSQRSIGTIVAYAFNAPASLELINCTVVNNTLVAPGAIATWGVKNLSSVTTTRSSLFANNAGGNFTTDGGTVKSLGFNLDSDGMSSFVNGSNGNIVGTIGSPIDPMLGPLQFNGGATQTRALLPGSPAIDKGNANGLTTDQRGFFRTVDTPLITNAGDGTDIGAFEFGSTQAPEPPGCNSGICYSDPQAWATAIQNFPSRFTNSFVVIPTENFGQPIRLVWDSGFGLQPSLSAIFALADGIGKKSISGQLLQKYLGAQLSLQTQVTFYYPQLDTQQIACNLKAQPGGNPVLPVTLSNGTILLGASTMQDLFNATNTALRTGNLADQTALLAIYQQLNTCRF